MKLEYVKGKRQLLPGKICPRCFHPQDRIRRLEAFRGESGIVVLYSCMECKRPISYEIERDTVAA